MEGQDPRVAGAEGPRRLDEVLALDVDDRATHDAGQAKPRSKAKRQDDVFRTRAENEQDAQEKDQRRDRVRQIDKSLHEVVELRAHVAADRAEQRGGEHSQQGRANADIERCPGPVHDAAEDIPPEVVGAEEVGAIRPFQVRTYVVSDRIVGDDHVRQRCGQHQHHQDHR